MLNSLADSARHASAAVMDITARAGERASLRYHGPERRYLIGRNTAWLGRAHLWREPAFAFLCLSRLGYEALGICLAEDQRLSKLLALLRGALVGALWGVSGGLQTDARPR